MKLLQATEVTAYFMKQGILGVVVVTLILGLSFMIREYRVHLRANIKASEDREKEHKLNIKDERDKLEAVSNDFVIHLVDSEKRFQEMNLKLIDVIKENTAMQKQLNETLIRYFTSA